ncbi:MAG: sugar phosphate isomerase/epimerase family protein [Bacteroidales bacterium]|nr:sugar phosphate isomerase/epimerase family protein [Bacteroidales bacterium]
MKKKIYFLMTVFLLSLSTINAKSGITIGVIQYDLNDIDKSFKELHDQGFTSCEINYKRNTLNEEFAKKVKKASLKHNIKVTTLVGVPGSKSRWNFTEGPSTIGLVPKEEREEKIKVYHEMIDFCSIADIPAMHSHFGFIPEDPGSEQYKDFISVMQQLANYAKERNVMIYFETGQETPTTLIRAIKDIGTGNVFINCDLANLMMYGKSNSLDAVKMFGSLIKEFHAKDGKYPNPDDPYHLGAEVPIPTGDVNFPAVIAELKKQGFNGALTIECELNGSTKDYVVETRKYLQDLLDKE